MFPLPNVNLSGGAASAAALIQGSGAFAFPHAGYRSGAYYCPMPMKFGAATASDTLSSNRIYYSMIYIFSDVTISALVYECTSGFSGSAILGLYAFDATAISGIGSLIVQSASTTVGSNGIKELAVSPTLLTRGFYWAALHVSQILSTRGVAQADCLEKTWGAFGQSAPGSGTTDILNFVDRGSYSALPTTPVAPTGQIGNRFIHIKVN